MSPDEIRATIVERLQSRRKEMEQTISAHVQDAVPDPVGSDVPEYQEGLRAAVTAVVDYCLEGIVSGSFGPIPSAAAAQARRAARAGVSVGTVLRRYVAGHRRIGEFVAEEAERGGFSSHGPAMQDIRRTQEALLEHLTAAIEHEYTQQQELIGGSRRSEIVQRLLSGEQVEPAELAELNYEIDTSWHLGLIASGAGVEEIARTLRARYRHKLLCVSLHGRVCAWLAVQERLTAEVEHLSTDGHAELSLAGGEPGRGFDGWRLTHHQARAAFAVALRRPERVAWYADGRLLAAALQNETLARSLTQKYLVPLGGQRDGGAKLRRTLRTYMDLECNATSAAHGLQVGRHTVESRVHTAERLIGSTLRECLPELDVALRLEELDDSHPG
jgi:hypothetical protein